MIPASCNVHFTKVNLSFGIVCRQFIGAFRKQFLKPFGLDQPEGLLLPSSELNGHPTRNSVNVSCSYFRIFFLFIFFDGQFRLFSFSDSNIYLDTEISIISLRFAGLEITLVLFSPLLARFLLCLHSTFLSFTVARGAIFKIVFFASV